jgi:hypothetical protein
LPSGTAARWTEKRATADPEATEQSANLERKDGATRNEAEE